MNTASEKFELNSDGISYIVAHFGTAENIYRLSSQQGTYLVAKDFYGSWVELTSKPGSAAINLALLGEQIEDHYKIAGLV